MCEYCGCQAVTAIGDLTAEHDAVRAVLVDVRRAAAAGDGAAATVGAGRLTALLRPHTAVEERGLFPRMATEFPDHIAGLTADHRHIEAVLDAVAAGELTEGWTARLADAAALLTGHIFKEQDGLFPAALATLGPDDWDAVDAVRAAVRDRVSA